MNTAIAGGIRQPGQGAEAASDVFFYPTINF